MTNIFEKVYFGKPYKTRDSSKAIFICKRTDNSRYDLNRPYACIVDGLGEIFNYYPNGKLYLSDNFETENDIVSEWNEESNPNTLSYNLKCYECKKEFYFKPEDIVDDIWISCPNCGKKLCILD